MCDHDAAPDSDPSEGRLSRRKFLQAGLALGAFAVTPTTGITPLLPDPGQETPGPEPETRLPATSGLQVAWPVPPIVTRAEWGADESRRAPDANYDFDSVVTKLVVHHTVTPNASADDASVVRGIYNYHTSTGYNDIAYNFLIGRDGRLYEGRWSRNYPGGVPHIGENALGRNVRAAHSTATNTQTIGVALIGDYRTDSPTGAQLDMLSTFLAWKIRRWNLNVFGDTVYLDGRRFGTISGHRDVTSTSCPGDAMYARMAALRDATYIKSIQDIPGYWLVTADGGVFTYGDAPYYGGANNPPLRQLVVDAVPTPSGNGYWMVTSDGAVFTFGDARYLGGANGFRLRNEAVGIAATPTGNGYWITTADGGVFSFGDARFYGGANNPPLSQLVVGIAGHPSGNGYWLVTADGAVFAYGAARYYGGVNGLPIGSRVAGMARTASGNGYWIAAENGGVFAFGDAPFHGSAGGGLGAPIEAIQRSRLGNGYLLVTKAGSVVARGDAVYLGAPAGLSNDCRGLIVRP